MKKNQDAKESDFRDFLAGDVTDYSKDEPLLRESMHYTGQYEELRNIGFKLFGAQKIARISDRQLADEIQKYYAVVSAGDEEIILVERTSIALYNQITRVISR